MVYIIYYTRLVRQKIKVTKMESLASNIAEKIALQMDYDKNKQAVVLISAAIIQMITIFYDVFIWYSL